MLERRAIIARRLLQTARARVRSQPAYPVTTRWEGMEEDSGATEGNCAKGIPDSGMEGSARRLPAGLDYQDHAGAENGDVAVAALEGRDGSLITCGDRVEGFAALYGVMDHGGLAGRGFGGVVP